MQSDQKHFFTTFPIDQTLRISQYNEFNSKLWLLPKLYSLLCRVQNEMKFGQLVPYQVLHLNKQVFFSFHALFFFFRI